MVDAGQQNQRVWIEDGRLCDVTTAGRAVSHLMVGGEENKRR